MTHDRRVLIVDDQKTFRMAARMVVEATDGFDVVGEAETGEDSVAMAAELVPDLVLMDVNLPGIDGLDRRARSWPGRATAPAPGRVAVLHVRRGGERPASRGCGASAYIPKAVFGPDRLETAWAAATGAA